MGSRTPHVLVDTTPAKTIVVYRNGDQFYVGRKFVLSRRRVATFEALLEQLTEQVEVPFGVRRLFTPTRGCPVLELDSLQAGGKYVAAGRERFKKLDYINIVPRKPAKMRKLKEIKPVVHCGMNVPSRWQTFHRMSRQINVFTNGRLFIPPVKIIIPKFSLMEWNSVLATVGEKVSPLGGVRKLFTMNGHLLDNSKDLQDNHFYVAAGLEAFKNFPYWKSPKVPSEVQQKYTDMEKHSRRKKKEDPKVKDTRKQHSVSPKTQDSVFYAKEGKKKPRAEALIQSGADGDVFKAQTPNQETQGAPEVKEAPDVHVELPVDGRPADIVKDAEETHRHMSDFESNREQEDEKLYEDNERKVCGASQVALVKKNLPANAEDVRDVDSMPGSGKLPREGNRNHFSVVDWRTPWTEEEDNSRMSFKKKFPLRHNTKKKASLKNLSKNKKVVPFPEEEPNDILEEKNTPVRLDTPVEKDQREPPVGQQSQESSPGQPDVKLDKQESAEQSSLGQPSQEQVPDKQEPPEPASLGQPSQEQLTQGEDKEQQIP